MIDVPYGYCQCGCGQLVKSPLRFVSGNHAARQYFERTRASRFWARVKILGNDDCWEWQGKKNKDGYGTIHILSFVNAHRFAYYITYGGFPSNLKVLHHCDNPACCNPRHLFLGTQADNIKDMCSKHRDKHPRGKSSWFILHPEYSPKGEGHPSAKLNTEKVKTIRAMAQAGKKHSQLARLFGVSYQSIRAIVLYKTWKGI